MKTLELNYWRKGLKEVPREAFSHAELEVESLPNEICSLKNLRTLDLGHNHFGELPVALAELENLSYLYLHENRLSNLRENLFQRMERLRYLNVSDNRLMRLPDSLGNLLSLEEFHADNNQVSELPDAFSNLTRLREIHLRNVGLNQVPPAIRQCRKLNILDLRGNLITELPVWIEEISELVKVDLRWNPFPRNYSETGSGIRQAEAAGFFSNRSLRSVKKHQEPYSTGL